MNEIIFGYIMIYGFLITLIIIGIIISIGIIELIKSNKRSER